MGNITHIWDYDGELQRSRRRMRRHFHRRYRMCERHGTVGTDERLFELWKRLQALNLASEAENPRKKEKDDGRRSA